MIHKTVQRGIDMGLIRYEDTLKGRSIEYIHQKKHCLIGKPEEWVRLMTYLHLVLLHDYPPEHIAIEYPIKMGSSYRYADIVVFSDADWQLPYILVECKRADISKKQFEEGVKQALSYARQITPTYVWITSGQEGQQHYGLFRGGKLLRLYYLPPFSIIRRFWREVRKIFGVYRLFIT